MSSSHVSQYSFNSSACSKQTIIEGVSVVASTGTSRVGEEARIFMTAFLIENR